LPKENNIRDEVGLFSPIMATSRGAGGCRC